MVDSSDRSQFPESDHSSSLTGEAIEWFARLRSEDCSAEERCLFESWRNRTPAHAAAYDEVTAFWNDPALHSAATQAAGTSRSVASYDPNTRRSSSWLRWGAIAATLAGLMVLIGLALDLPLLLTSEFSTSPGERQVVQLSDGSIVTVNTRSAIRTAYDHQSRRVELLKGEAFFQVAPDSQKPFVVRSSEIATRAVGTAFLVRQEPAGVRVTVTEGVVELAPVHHGWAPVQITAGKQIVVSSGGPGPVRDVSVGRTTAWLRGRLVVEDARLADVIAELHRYHSGAIVVWDHSINEIRVSGSYNLADPTAVLLALTETLPIRMVRLTDHLVVLF